MELKVYSDIKILGPRQLDLDSVLTREDLENLMGEHQNTVSVKYNDEYNNIDENYFIQLPSTSDASIFRIRFTRSESNLTNNLNTAHSFMFNIDDQIDLLIRQVETGKFRFYCWPKDNPADINIRYTEYLGTSVGSQPNFRTSLRRNCRIFPTTNFNNNDCYVEESIATPQNSIAPLLMMQVTRDYLGENGIIPKRYEISAYIDPSVRSKILLSIRKIS